MTADWLPAGARLPRPGDEDAARAHWARWREAGPPAGADGGAAGALLDAVFGNSPYLSRCLVSDPAFSRLLLEEGPDAAFAAALEEASSAPADEAEDSLMARLRAAKRRAALATGVADIAGVWPLERVTGGLSDFAEASLRAACRRLLRAAAESGRLDLPDPGDPEAGSGLIVLGMGKLGARELNYSSDIDIIVLYDEDAAPVAAGAEPGRVFVRLARRLLRIMDERTADGYVFRTDLRLRPDPASTPLALSARAAERYYREAGRTWERAAMIKVRPVAGDPRAGEAFLDVLRDFVWRRRLDFVAVQEMREIKRQIDSSRGGGGGDSVAGRNVKLGRGGIREIEFFAQAQQLAWGGRDPELRPRGTLEAIDALAAAGQVDGGAVAELREAYRFLRGVEHRLQMVDDRQTHSLPGDEAGVAAAAAFAGFDSTGEFSAALLARLRTVGRHYDGLFADRPAADRAADELAFPEDADDPATLRALAELGYADPARASATARGWRAGHHSAMREELARELAAALAPAALAAFAAAPAPDAALARFDALLSRAGDGARLFSLLSANPGLLDLVADVTGSAPRLADLLTRHPDVLDSVLSRDFADLEAPDDLGREPGVALAARRGLVRLFYAREFGAREMKADLAEAARRAGDLQDLFDVQRRWANERQFQIGVHLLRGLLAPMEAAGPLSDIAETCLHALTPAVAEEFAARHGRVPGGRAAVVAFGKLGSREMTVGSDLDLMFLYDADPGAERSDGRRPLAPGAYYGRLCRRLIAALTAPTAEGSPYDVDMRLRPSGAAGPIACSLAAFAAYHEKEAWTWERQALTRARVVLSTGGLGEEFEHARLDVLARPRERGALAADVAAMRERIRSERGGGGGRWSVRHMRGGLLDVEFIAQFLQLLHAAEAPDVLARDSISVFGAAGARGLVDAGAARELAEAAALWRNLEGVIRAAVGARAEGEEAEGAIENLLARSSGKAVLDALVESMRDTAERVARRFDELVASQAA